MAISKEQAQDYNYKGNTKQQYQVRGNYVYEGITVASGLVDMDASPHDRTYGSAVDFAIELWKNSEEGKWCQDRCADMQIMKEPDYASFGYKYAIRCWLTPTDATFYRMKWGQD